MRRPNLDGCEAPNPNRIREAQSAGFRARMVGAWNVPSERAGEILDAWEAEVAAHDMARNDASRRLDESWLRGRISRSRTRTAAGSKSTWVRHGQRRGPPKRG